MATNRLKISNRRKRIFRLWGEFLDQQEDENDWRDFVRIVAKNLNNLREELEDIERPPEKT